MGNLGFALILAGVLACLAQSAWRTAVERRMRALAASRSPTLIATSRRPSLVIWWSQAGERLRTALASCAGALPGLRLAGLPGAALGVAVAFAARRMLARRTRLRSRQAIERQLADLVDACMLAVRGGASVAQALEIATQEVDEPMASIASRALAEQRLGVAFEPALRDLAAAVGSEDARLFALVMSIHHRSGGNVAGPLAEVATTIRHRIAVRRELRALTAQGRISGAVLGTLPVAFFLVLSATSHHELAPVYRSPAGAAMVIAGLVLEGVAYVWIRHLLKVEA